MRALGLYIFWLISVSSFAQSTNFEYLIEGCRQCQSPCPSMQAALRESDDVEWGVVKNAEISSIKLGVQYAPADSSKPILRIVDSSFLAVLNLNILSSLQNVRALISVRDFAVRKKPPEKMLQVGDSVLVGFETGILKAVIPIRNYSGICGVEESGRGRYNIFTVKISP